MNDLTEGHEVMPMTAESATVALLNRSEIDTQITTAKKYPRSITHFIRRATELVTMNESIARQCIYALQRKDKDGNKVVIEGPSARMAEIIFNAWGNSRAGARVVSDQGDFVTAQGVFHDLEQNVAITFEVQRRIVGSRGQRYSADMIGVTGNAASSIALRNAILKGVPKAYWEPMYAKARQLIAGDIQSLPTRRAALLKEFVIFGISTDQILAKLGKPGVQDIGLDDFVILSGILTAIKEGDTTPEQAFAAEEGTTQRKPAEQTTTELPAMADEEFKKSLANWQKIIAKGTKTPDQIIATAQTKNKLTDEQIAAIRALAPKADAGPLADRKDIDAILTAATEAAVSTADICKKFGIAAWPDVPAAIVPQVLEFINNPIGA